MSRTDQTKGLIRRESVDYNARLDVNVIAVGLSQRTLGALVSPATEIGKLKPRYVIRVGQFDRGTTNDTI